MARMIQAWWYRRRLRKHKVTVAFGIAELQSRYMTRAIQEANV